MIPHVLRGSRKTTKKQNRSFITTISTEDKERSIRISEIKKKICI
jgi:hypothetical protein